MGSEMQKFEKGNENLSFMVTLRV